MCLHFNRSQMTLCQAKSKHHITRWSTVMWLFVPRTQWHCDLVQKHKKLKSIHPQKHFAEVVHHTIGWHQLCVCNIITHSSWPLKMQNELWLLYNFCLALYIWTPAWTKTFFFVLHWLWNNSQACMHERCKELFIHCIYYLNHLSWMVYTPKLSAIISVSWTLLPS